MKLQVLVATMHQSDLSLADKMNIHCDALIANQAELSNFASDESASVKMITTKTRGVGLNRNIALLASDADIILMSDDDVVYNDDMASSVIGAFEKHKDADVIIFGMDILKNGELKKCKSDKFRRLHIYNSMRYGTYRLAARREKLVHNNITFNQCFGGGCTFSAGEDTLFIKSCFDSGLKVYYHPYVLGTCCKDSSTWFNGFNEKYFYDKGVLVRKLFPKTAYIMALYFGLKYKNRTDLSVSNILRLVYKGVRFGKKMIPFEDVK